MKRKLKLLTATLVAMIATAALAVAASSPAVVTGSATSVGDTAANIHGTVNPEGSATSYFFQWGVSTTYGFQSPTHSAGSGTKTVSVGTIPTALIPGTVYHYRLVASNRFGASLGRDRTFRTTGHPPAIVFTGPPFVIGHDFGILTGNIDPEGAPTGWAFQYGTTSAYGVQSFGGTVPASTSFIQVHETIGGLAAGTTFHYRLIAYHGAAVVSYGADQTFTTYPFTRPKPGIHAHTTPHHVVSTPYVFTTNGSLTLPRSIPPGAGCNGIVAARYFVGRKSYALAIGGVHPDCTFSVPLLFHRLVGGRSTRLRVEVRFRGNPYLESVSPRAERVSLG